MAPDGRGHRHPVRAHHPGAVLRGGLGASQKVVAAPAPIFAVFGIVLGPFGFNLIEGATDTTNFTVIAQLALTVMLFNQAAELDLGAAVRRGDVTFPPRRAQRNRMRGHPLVSSPQQ